MMTPLSLLTAALPAFVLSVSSLRAAEIWETDFAKAKAAAAKDHKDLLINFSGSDLNPLSILLSGEVFEKDAFKQAAPKDFVLMMVDFPKDTEGLAEDLLKQNQRLKEEYYIDQVCTIVLADAQGRPYAVTGYEKGGEAHYLAHLTELRKKRQVRDEALKKAAAASGVEKAKLILGALKPLKPEWMYSFYRKEIEEAIAADKEDATGVKKSRDEYSSEAEFKAKADKLEEQLAELNDQKKFKEFVALVDKFIQDEKLTGRRKQEIIMAKMGAFEEDLPGSLKVLDEAIAVDPASDLARDAKEMKEFIIREQKQQKEESAAPGKPAKKAGKDQ